MAGMLILNVADQARALCATSVSISTSSPARVKRKGEKGDHSLLLAPGPGWVRPSAPTCSLMGWAVRRRQTMAQQHGPRRAIGRVRGGRPFRNISHSRGKPAALPLCPWIVSKWQPPRWIPPMKTVSRASSSAGPCRRRPSPGWLPRCANADRTEGRELGSVC